MLHRRRQILFAVFALASSANLPAAWAQSDNSGFDHAYAAWDALLKRHVRWLPDNKQTRVAYKGFLADRPALQKVLAQWSAVTPALFGGWSREQKMAFLINSYNGFTIELILTRYPDLNSIKDLGNVLQTPWKKKFFRLLGDERYLDWIEHEQLRPSYADWRVHAALNCASIGCPALQPEAFTAQTLDAQLEDAMARFMGDPTRNRYAEGRAELSEIFKWFREDFEKGHKGVRNLEQLVLRYADALRVPLAERAEIRTGTLRIRYIAYDWSLNDAGR